MSRLHGEVVDASVSANKKWMTENRRERNNKIGIPKPLIVQEVIYSLFPLFVLLLAHAIRFIHHEITK